MKALDELADRLIREGHPDAALYVQSLLSSQGWVPSIVVCLSICLFTYLRDHMPKLHKMFCTCTVAVAQSSDDDGARVSQC